MPVLKAESATMHQVRQGLSGRMAYTNNLMMVVMDFSNGPWNEPEPLQHHVHEQVICVSPFTSNRPLCMNIYIAKCDRRLFLENYY